MLPRRGSRSLSSDAGIGETEVKRKNNTPLKSVVGRVRKAMEIFFRGLFWVMDRGSP